MTLFADLYSFPSTSSQIQKKGNPQLVLTKEQCKIDDNSLFILEPSLMFSHNTVLTTVKINNFQKITEDPNIIEAYDDELDIIVPLKFKRMFTKTINIKSIEKYIPNIIID